MANSLANPAVRGVLDKLFTAADEVDGPLLAEISARYGQVLGAGSASERAELYGSLYIPVSPECGRLLYSLIRAGRPQTVVEFGTSFGIATIHLAAAVRDNGAGRVISTELNAVKAERAREHVAEAGLGDVVDIVTGDALDTLASVTGPVGFALLDGWPCSSRGCRPGRWWRPTTPCRSRRCWRATWATSATRRTGTSARRSRSVTASR
jgi:hypothetical protein